MQVNFNPNVNPESINFKAKLLIQKPIKNVSRWERIAEKFASKTSEFANFDCFVLENQIKNLTLGIKDFNKDRIFDQIHPYKLILSLKGTEELLKLSDEEIVDKFKLLLSLIKKNKEVLKTEPYTKESRSSYESQSSLISFEKVLQSVDMYNVCENQRAIEKDPVLAQNIYMYGFNDTPYR